MIEAQTELFVDSSNLNAKPVTVSTAVVIDPAAASTSTGIEVEPPHEYLCGITMELMLNPDLVNPSGYSYESSELARWREKNNTDPITRQVINSVTPNRALKDAIDRWRVANNIPAVSQTNTADTDQTIPNADTTLSEENQRVVSQADESETQLSIPAEISSSEDEHHSDSGEPSDPDVASSSGGSYHSNESDSDEDTPAASPSPLASDTRRINEYPRHYGSGFGGWRPPSVFSTSTSQSSRSDFAYGSNRNTRSSSAAVPSRTTRAADVPPPAIVQEEELSPPRYADYNPGTNRSWWLPVNRPRRGDSAVAKKSTGGSRYGY